MDFQPQAFLSLINMIVVFLRLLARRLTMLRIAIFAKGRIPMAQPGRRILASARNIHINDKECTSTSSQQLISSICG